MMPTGSPADPSGPDGGERIPGALQQGLALLEEQRAALCERSVEQVESINARLRQWLQVFDAGTVRPDPASLHALRTVLDANSELVRQSALRITRALDVLLPPVSGSGAPLYSRQGLPGGTARRATIRSTA